MQRGVVFGVGLGRAKAGLFDCALFKQFTDIAGGQRLFSIFQNAAILPERKVTGAVFAHKALGTFGNGSAAFRAASDSFTERRKELIRVFGTAGITGQVNDHLTNIAHEVLGLLKPLFNALQPLFPLGGQLCGAELFRQHGDERFALVCRQKNPFAPIANALYQLGVDQLF